LKKIDLCTLGEENKSKMKKAKLSIYIGGPIWPAGSHTSKHSIVVREKKK
jgi:hypothetical protein